MESTEKDYEALKKLSLVRVMLNKAKKEKKNAKSKKT